MINPNNIRVTIKGRVGDFEYGYVGAQQWIVRNRANNAIVWTGRDLAGASKEAGRLHIATKG